MSRHRPHQPAKGFWWHVGDFLIFILCASAILIVVMSLGK